MGLTLATVPRRVAGLEAQRTAAALARLRAADERYLAAHLRRPAEERARRQADLDALPAGERATVERQAAALNALTDPTTPPAGIAHAAAVLGDTGAPTWEILADLAEKLAGWASAAETRG